MAGYSNLGRVQERQREIEARGKIPGWAEPLATLGSGLASSTLGGLAALGTVPANLLGLSKSSPADVLSSIQQQYTYAPRSTEGQAALHAIGTVAEKLHEPVAWAADKTLAATGSPALATAVDVAPTALGALAGLPGGPVRAAVRDLRAAIPDIAPSIGGGAATAYGQQGALFGIKRHGDYWHGVSGGPDVARQILREGKFKEGQSAELQIPGTSLSTDPLLSLRSFAHRMPGALLKVEVDYPTSRVRNLKPSEYLTGMIPEERVYRKPNLFHSEAETFGRRVPNTDPTAFEMLADKRGALEDKRQALAREVHDSGVPLQHLKTERPDLFEQYQILMDESNKIRAELREFNQMPPPFVPREPSFAEFERIAALDDNLKRYDVSTEMASRATDTPPRLAINEWYDALQGLRGHRAIQNRALENTVGQPRTTLNPVLGLDYAGMSKAADFLAPRYSDYRQSLQSLYATKKDIANAARFGGVEPEMLRAVDALYGGTLKARGNYVQGLDDIFLGRMGHYR